MLRIKYLNEKVGASIPAPLYATPGSAAMDVCACIDEPVRLVPGASAMIPLGFAVACEPTCAVFLYARSGLACKSGIRPSNCVGVIDSDYRGEVMVSLHNDSDRVFFIHPGDRIAQMAVMPIIQEQIQVVDDLEDTERGAGGFGSTGMRG
jgi:dUTP pyrophosphatase